MSTSPEIGQEPSAFKDFTSFCVDLAMIFCPSIGYISQGNKFLKTKSSEGFQTKICAILIFANSLRLFFWLGRDFTVVLLFQALVVIISQFYIIHCYLKCTKGDLVSLPVQIENSTKEKDTNFNLVKFMMNKLNFKNTFDLNQFWKWKEEDEYYKITFAFLFTFYVLCKLIGFDKTWFFNIVGGVGTGCETIMALPQIIEICNTKNANNVSLLMVFFWMCGDVFKTGYYLGNIIVYNSI